MASDRAAEAWRLLPPLPTPVVGFARSRLRGLARPLPSLVQAELGTGRLPTATPPPPPPGPPATFPSRAPGLGRLPLAPPRFLSFGLRPRRREGRAERSGKAPSPTRTRMGRAVLARAAPRTAVAPRTAPPPPGRERAASAPAPAGPLPPRPPAPSRTVSPVRRPVARPVPPVVPPARGIGPPAPVRRFAEATSTQAVEPPRPLPVPLRPMIRRISGSRPVPRMTTGPATRRALRVARSPAAASPGLVHLPRTPTPSPADLEMVAHETVHATGATRLPRLFTGDLPDREERIARTVGREVREAAPAPREAASALPGSTPPATPGLPRPPRPARPMRVDPLPRPGVAELPVGPVPAPVGRPQESPPPASPSPEPAPAPALESKTAGRAASAARGPTGGPGGPDAPAAPEWGEDLLELLEERLLAEIERRGGRYAGVF